MATLASVPLVLHADLWVLTFLAYGSENFYECKSDSGFSSYWYFCHSNKMCINFQYLTVLCLPIMNNRTLWSVTLEIHVPILVGILKVRKLRELEKRTFSFFQFNALEMGELITTMLLFRVILNYKQRVEYFKLEQRKCSARRGNHYFQIFI